MLKIATELDLPVVFHCREGFKDLFPLLKTYKPRGILHCFTGTGEEAKEVVDLGLHISLSGILTYPKSQQLRDIAKAIPLDRLLIETDAPFLAPQSKRGKTNEPLFIQETLKILADTLGLPAEKVAEETYKNTLQLFK